MWYGYYFWSAGQVVWAGITTDLDRREGEHRDKWPKGFIDRRFGPASFAEARNWEDAQHAKGYPGAR